MKFYSQCVYAAYGKPTQESGEFIIKKTRPMLVQAFEKSKTLDQEVLVFFADASYDSSALMSCSILKDVRILDNQTLVEFTPAQPIKKKIKASALHKLSDNKEISTDIRRGVILCHTPYGHVKLIEQVEKLNFETQYEGFYSDEELSAFEGEPRRQMVTHRRRERSLREAKIQSVLKKTGKLACEVPGCSFDFYDKYGKLGQGYTQVHHLTPLSQVTVTKTTLANLAIVCANCHAMIHRGGQCRELTDLIK